MAAWRRILGVLRRSPETGDPLPDGELLARFAASRDQAAFELLVWRHAAMVFGVCRRALRDEHLAEDAFQAVFLVLARKAGAVRSANVAGWLFRVARRVSVRAAKRLTIAQPVAVEPCAPALPDRLEQDELRALLDAEIARLPERFRLPVLLCYLGGQSTEDAARQLGVPRGTILSRLSTARERLAGRLTRRGVTIPAVVVATPNLVTSTVSAAAAFAARLPHLATRPALVAEGVLRTMTITKLVPVAALFVITGLVSGYGLRSGAAHTVAIAQPPAKPAPIPPPPPAADERERDLRRVKYREMSDNLRVQIEKDDSRMRDFALRNRTHARTRAQAEQQLALLEAELFASERELLEGQTRRAVTEARLAAIKIEIAEVDVSHHAANDPRVIAATAEHTATARAVTGAKVATVPPNPSLAQLEKLAEQRAATLASVTKTASEDVRKTMVAERRAGQLAQLTGDLDEKLEITKRVLVQRKKLRDELEGQLRERDGSTVELERQADSLKVKREFLSRIETELLRLELPDIPAAPKDVNAKLDQLLLEVEALRKDVSELKKR